MMPRFRIPMTPAQAYSMLLAFYQAEVEYRRMNFILDSELASRLSEVATILTAERPKSGLLLCGHCGNGKTTLIYALRALINYLRRGNYFDTEISENIAVMIKNSRELSNMARQDYPEFLKWCRYPKILAIDDMGEEPHEVLDYGNVVNPVLELLEYRYDNQLTTFITTNLDPEEIEDKYKERISDRLSEMMEKVVFRKRPEESYRKNIK